MAGRKSLADIESLFKEERRFVSFESSVQVTHGLRVNEGKVSVEIAASLQRYAEGAGDGDPLEALLALEEAGSLTLEVFHTTVTFNFNKDSTP